MSDLQWAVDAMKQHLIEKGEGAIVDEVEADLEAFDKELEAMQHRWWYCAEPVCGHPSCTAKIQIPPRTHRLAVPNTPKYCPLHATHENGRDTVLQVARVEFGKPKDTT
jgi:hypothetical protein